MLTYQEFNNLTAIVGLCGIVMLGVGLLLGRKLRTIEKMYGRGLDRLPFCSFSYRFQAFFTNPDVTIPAILVCLGGLSTGLALLGFFTALLAWLAS